MKSLFNNLAERLERYDIRLAAVQAEGFLAFLGLVSGIAAGALIVADEFSHLRRAAAGGGRVRLRISPLRPPMYDRSH